MNSFTPGVPRFGTRSPCQVCTWYLGHNNMDISAILLCLRCSQFVVRMCFAVIGCQGQAHGPALEQVRVLIGASVLMFITVNRSTSQTPTEKSHG